jgi:large repetitive protein
VAATIAVLANDRDVDGDGLVVGNVTQGTNGTVAINADGTVSYTPNAGFFGTDLFEYTVSDGQGGTDTGLVSVTVDQADDNDAPVLTEVADRTITEGQEVRFTVVAADADDPAGSLVYSVTSGLPAGATFNAATREFVWVPADEEGNEVTTLVFTVLDPDGATDTMDVVLTVTNAKPTVNAGADQVVGLQKVKDDHDHGHGYHHREKGEATVSIAATFNDRGTLDTHANHHTTIDWGDGHVTKGSVSESPFGPPGSTAGANGTVTGSHTYRKAGVYTVKVTVTDDDGASSTDTLTVTVRDPSKHLKARADEYKLREDGVLQVNAAHGVLNNDRAPGSAPLTARLVEGPDHGRLSFNADGSFTYRPDANFHGEDAFWYEFTDGTNVSKAVKVELAVKSDGRREVCIDWGGHGGWHGGHFGGGKHANFVDFLIKLARRFD